VLLLYIDQQRSAARIGELPEPAFDTCGIAWISAWKVHHARKLVPPKQRGLVHEASERRSGTWNHPDVVGQARPPIKTLLILCQREVVKKGIASIKEIVDSTAADV
jgi:hypothetical protein